MEPIQASAQVADYSAVDAFLEGRHSQPHDLLGHHLGPGGLTITAYRPMASSVRAKLGDGTLLDLPHVKGGVWSGTTGAVTQSQDYRLLVNYGDGVEHEEALKLVEQRRRAAPLDKDTHPDLYWPAVFELAALAGE